jgi:hypothetical protein
MLVSAEHPLVRSEVAHDNIEGWRIMHKKGNERPNDDLQQCKLGDRDRRTKTQIYPL